MKKKRWRPKIVDLFLRYMNPPEFDEENDYYDDEEEDGLDEEREETPGPKLYKEPGRRGNLRLVKNGDVEPETGDDDEDDDDERPWMSVLTFLGLAVLAAIICAILWYFTHPDQSKDEQGTPPGAAGALEPGSDANGTGGNKPGQSTEEPGEGAGDPVEGTGQAAGDPAEGTGQAAGGGQVSNESPGEGENDVQGTDGGGNLSEEEEADAEFQESAGEETAVDQEPASGTSSMKFDELKESVTPKDVVNLRSVPTTADESNIVVQCKNGEILIRTGINKDTGWSQVVYGDQTLYAVSQYLTADLDYKPPVQASNPNRVGTASGRVVIFTNCDDWISPKEYVNLRTEPSTDAGNDTVSCQLNYGEKAHRTGYSADSGWSRVEYDGKVLYVVTSLMYEVEPD